jgi:hypothetical protein
MSKRKIRLTSVHLSFSDLLKTFGSPSEDVLEVCDQIGAVVGSFVLNKAKGEKAAQSDTQTISVKYFSSIRKAKKCVNRSIKIAKKIYKINNIPFIHFVNKEKGLK